MTNATIITCAVTGAGDTPGKSRAVPVTPEEIAQSSIEAAGAGAAIIHIHVRSPDTGLPSRDPALFREVVARIRDSGCGALLNLTTGEGGMLGIRNRALSDDILDNEVSAPEQRFAHVADNLPEMCTIDMGTMNVDQDIFVNTTFDVTRLAELSAGAGVLPELEVFDAGQIQFSKELINAGKVQSPAFFQLCLGVPGGSPATPETLLYLKSLLPQGSPWAAFGIGAQQFPMVAQCAISGGHVRVSLEDNLYLEKGVLAPSNASMVEKAANIIALLGGNVAGPGEAKRLLSIS